MFFLTDFTLLCADEFTVPLINTDVSPIYKMTLSNALFDEIYVSSEDVEISTVAPKWDYDTRIHAEFEEKTAAGNMTWTLDTVDGILIKRKEENSTKWTTIQYKHINTFDDFNVAGRDYTPGNGHYQYSIVPVLGYNEGTYASTRVDTHVDELVLVDINEYFSTPITDGACNVTFNAPTQTIETLYNKYPTIISNSDACYQTIEVTGSFYPNICDPDSGIFDDKTRIEYIDKVLKFLTNKKPKILKNIDGRRWLVYITTPPTDSMADIYKFRTITLTCTEIGDIDDEESLYYVGLIDVDSAFWG